MHLRISERARQQIDDQSEQGGSVMTSQNPRADIYDPNTLAVMDQAFAAIWNVLRADDPFLYPLEILTHTECRIFFAPTVLRVLHFVRRYAGNFQLRPHSFNGLFDGLVVEVTLCLSFLVIHRMFPLLSKSRLHHPI
jgi:hypothetical protein